MNPGEPLRLDRLSPTLWRRVSELFDQVIERPESERIPFIRELWAREPEAARELTAMLMAAAESERRKTITHASFQGILGEALAEPAASFQAGAQFGVWMLETCLGRGGMGEVWRARRNDGLYQASVAIKFLRTDAGNRKALAARFARERAVLARLNHPNIARFIDAGIQDEQAYIVLELIDGQPLIEYIRQNQPGLRRRIEIVRDLCQAIEHAHNQLVLHRDLKPSNVLITRQGEVKLLDFGVAGFIETPESEPHTKLTQLTGRALTLEYASPEQVAGEATTPASDVYSLGVLLFHLGTGNRPFAQHSSRAALEYALLNSDPPLASASIARGAEAERVVDHMPPPADAEKLDGDLDRIIGKAMRLNPSERYPSAAALAADLTAWLDDRPISFRQGERAHAIKLWIKRHRTATLAAAVSVLTGIILIGVLALELWQTRQALKSERQVNEALLQSLGPARHESLQRAEQASERPETRRRLRELMQKP